MTTDKKRSTRKNYNNIFTPDIFSESFVIQVNGVIRMKPDKPKYKRQKISE
jgi:hypothetical protein